MIWKNPDFVLELGNNHTQRYIGTQQLHQRINKIVANKFRRESCYYKEITHELLKSFFFSDTCFTTSLKKLPYKLQISTFSNYIHFYITNRFLKNTYTTVYEKFNYLGSSSRDHRVPYAELKSIIHMINAWL